MTRPIIITHEKLGYVAKDVQTNIASQGKNIYAAMENLKEALELYFEDSVCDEPQEVF